MTTTLTKAIAASIESASDFKSLMKSVGEAVAPDAPPTPANLPLPAVITDDQRAALSRLSDVYGSVVPTERRAITPDEADDLMEERLVMDEIKGMIETRNDSIRATLFNHFDVEHESSGNHAGTYVDAKGHYVAPAALRTTINSKTWKREVRQPAPTLSAGALLALVESGELSAADYEAMTSTVRVVDEAKVMDVLRERPELTATVAKAIEVGKPTAALYVRKSTT